MKSLLSHGSLVALVALALLVESASSASAASYAWIGAGTGGNTATDPSDPSTLWGTAGNWSPSTVPGSSDTALLALSNAGYVNAQTASINTLNVDGTTTSGALSITGSNVILSSSLVYLGYNAIGNAVQGGGTLSVSGPLYLGYNFGSIGSYALSAGQLTEQFWEFVGSSGTGTFNQTGGTNSVIGDLLLGSNSGSTGSYSLSNGQLAVEASELVGYVGAGTGTFNQTGGSNTVGSLSIGNSGTYTLAGGTLNVTGLVNGSGSLSITGGALLVPGLQSTGTFNFGGGTLVARASFSTSQAMTLTGSGGNATVDTGVYGVTLSGVLSGTGGLNEVGAGTLILSGSNDYSGGTYVDGGTLNVTISNALPESSSLTVGTSGTVVFDDPPGAGVSMTDGATFAAPRGAVIVAVPEPSTLALLSSAMLGLGVVYLRRRGAKA